MDTVYSVSAQETAKHLAKFGWPPVIDVAAVMKPRREKEWEEMEEEGEKNE